MKILTVPHPILSQTALPVKAFDARLQALIDGMKVLLLAQKDPIGVGLSGNQVGALQRVFLIRPDEKKKDITVYVNPRVIETVEGDPKRKPTLEGCLSIPAMWGHVLRAEKVKLAYQDESGIEKSEWLDGFNAIVAQHELDHLDGILFTQRVLEQNRTLFKEIDGELERWEI